MTMYTGQWKRQNDSSTHSEVMDGETREKAKTAATENYRELYNSAAKAAWRTRDETFEKLLENSHYLSGVR